MSAESARRLCPLTGHGAGKDIQSGGEALCRAGFNSGPVLTRKLHAAGQPRPMGECPVARP
ncbi:entericidin A/B family lipoprotein [Streptomyces sp. NPDC057623]|uniref:entericidin A/B family lipoprotein n=1 Tax=Streptomyces sp. NPDC057623 TaxID=3346187 RepID=UPI0036836F1A